MAHIRHLITSADALQRVFFPIILPAAAHYCSRPTTSSEHSIRQTRSITSVNHQATTRPPLLQNYGPKSTSKGQTTDIHLRDEAIRSPLIHLVDPTTSSLLPPTSLTSTLATLDRTKDFLIQVDTRPDSSLPICKIVSKRTHRAFLTERSKAQRAAAKASSSGGAGVKQIELGWAVSPHDLGHRMKQVEGFLARGRKVEVLIAQKKEGRSASLQEAQGVVRGVRERVEMVGGAREWKEMKGVVGMRCTMYFQGGEK
ncbi:hypothetical protein MMC06_003624 [Schaereria dolodes]|nr:hypothetical protein [Schaereria dolodes]